MTGDPASLFRGAEPTSSCYIVLGLRDTGALMSEILACSIPKFQLPSSSPFLESATIRPGVPCS